MVKYANLIYTLVLHQGLECYYNQVAPGANYKEITHATLVQ